MITYKNGTYQVEQFKDGTKILKDETGQFKAEFPDNLDVKITNYCDVGCKFCYEDSGEKGSHCKADDLLDKLSDLPPGIEVTLGGGNPISHPEIIKIVKNLSIDQKKLVSLTINQKSIDLELIFKCIESGLRAIGISPNPGLNQSTIVLDEVISIPIVYHFILGVHPLEQIEKYLLHGKKILILGYKNVGRGKNNIPEIKNWVQGIKRFKHRLEYQEDYPKTAGMSFDNLAIHQLNLRTSFTTSDWEHFYLGDDGSCSMYIDAVEGTYSKSSTVSKISRTSWDGLGILDYFKNDKTDI
jgi:hypothetical protein